MNAAPVTVSFIVPAYNSARYLRETLDSVLSDPRGDIEVIVIDDGSTDDTQSVLQRIDDSRLRVLTQANMGLPGARNSGIAISKGEFFVFLDADDIFRMEALEAMLAAMRAHPEAALSYTALISFKDGGEDMPRNPLNRLNRRPSGPVLRQVLQQNFLGAPGACLIRRTALVACGPFNPTLRMSEDWEFFCRLACHGTFVFIPDVIALRYRQHLTSMSSSRGLDIASYHPFIAAVFDNPLIASRFTPSELAHLQRSQLAQIQAFIAMKAMQAGAVRKSVAALWAAVTGEPRRAVDFLGRYGWSVIQWTMGGALGRRR